MFIGVYLPYPTHETPPKHIHWYKNWYELHPLSGVLPAEHKPNPAVHRITLAQPDARACCTSKQYSKGITVDPYDIEDTSDWLGSPTQLGTVTHYANMLEEDVEELRRQLHSTKENISTLVEMNDQLSAELLKKRTWMANLEAQTTDQLAQIRSLTWVLDQKGRIIRQLQAGNQA
jgi:regulator of replication initiation timing